MTTDALADIIRNRRIALGYSQDMVADFCDIDRTALGRIENHYRTMTVEQADKLIRALGLGELGIIPASQGSGEPYTIASMIAESTGNEAPEEPMFETPKEYATCAVIADQKTSSTIYGQMDSSGKKLLVRNDDAENKMDKNIFLVGNSGSGKTQYFCKSYLEQALKRGESVIVLDEEGVLMNETKDAFEAAGYVVKTLNVGAKNPEASEALNILPSLDGDKMDNVVRERAMILSETILDAYGKTIQPRLFDLYQNCAHMLLSSVIEYVLCEAEDKNMGTVISILRKGLDYLQDSLFADENIPGAYDFKTVLMASPNLRANVYVQVMQILECLPPQVMLSDTEFFDIFKKPAAVFIRWLYADMRPDQLGNVSFIVTYLRRMAALYADSCPEHALIYPLTFVFDGFPALPYNENFWKALFTSRKRGISFVFTVQSLTQLSCTYPDNWDTILSCCGTLISFGNSDMFTSTFLNKRIGDTVSVVADNCKKQKEVLDKISDMFGVNVSVEQISVGKLPPLKDDEAYILFQGHRPIKAKKYMK